MNDAAKWWYYVRQNGASYYPQTVADLGYDVWDWSTLNAGTLFQDSAKTTPVTANAQPVGAWVDGVSGVDAVRATTANKPTYTTASLNGLPTLAFDGSDLLSTANISISTFAVWCVFISNVTVPSLPYEQSVDSGANDGMFLNTNAPSTIRIRRGALLSVKGLSTNWANDNTWRITRHGHNGTHATHTLAINDNLQTMSDTTASDVGTGTASQPLFIGARSGVVAGMTGNIAHLCIVSPYPTNAIIANMESYINGIWGVY